MSLAALDSLAKGKLDLFDIMLNFVKWLENGEYTPTGKSFDVGRTCLNAIRNFHRNCYTNAGEYILPPDFDITECGEKGELSNGNGSLMRINPFILWARFKSGERVDIEELVEQASKITHAHECSVLACKIYALLMYYLIADQSRGSLVFALDDIYCRYCDEKEYPRFARIFDENFANMPVDEIKSTGYVVDSLEAAIWCLLNTDNYKDCVLKAVNLGGDTDTIAAIAGGLAGLMYGYESIPQEWLNTLIKREEIEELCERAERAWKNL
jgi:ADP-ribosylglycohydrolase